MKQTLAVVGAVVLSSLVGVAGAHAEKEKSYSAADLKALVDQKSFAEAVAHLGDVAPSERKGEWTAIAVDAATGYLAGLASDDLVQRVVAIEDLDKSFPALIKDAKFAKTRAKLGLEAYGACFEIDYAIDECFQHATKFVTADASNADLTLAMAKLMRRSANAYSSAPMFKLAVAAAGKGAATVCKDPDLKLAIMAALDLPEDYEQAIAARAVSGGACYDALKKDMVAAFDADAVGSYFATNTCSLLMGKKALNAEQAKQCK